MGPPPCFNLPPGRNGTVVGLFPSNIHTDPSGKYCVGNSYRMGNSHPYKMKVQYVFLFLIGIMSLILEDGWKPTKLT